MLKLIRGLVLAVAVIVANAYVPPTYASSSNVVISHIFAGGMGAALQELVMLYNNSPFEVELTHWCIKNKSNVSIVCFTPETALQRIYLPSHSYATIATSALVDPSAQEFFTYIYTPTNQNSGSIIGSADTISLIDESGMIIDSHSWTTPLTAGMLFARLPSAEPSAYLDTDQFSDWEMSRLQGMPDSGVVRREEPSEPLPTLLPLRITELLPNAKGSDEGNEFIELYNPNDVDVDLSGYVLRVGPSLDTSFTFPSGSIMSAHSYVSFTNSEINFTLLNTSSRVQLSSVEGVVLDEVPSYENPADDTSWALIAGTWQYIKPPTPGSENRGDAAGPVEDATMQPCAANQYRSPETGRCRLIAIPATAAPCKDGQYRSEETNRCRNIATDANTPKPCEADEERNSDTGRCRKIVVAALPVACKEGQERNPETNRCRNVVAMTKADYAVLGTQTSSGSNWYIWATVIGLLLAAIGYAVWEWRWELSKLWVKFVKLVRTRK